MPTLLSPEQIEAALTNLPHWRSTGAALVRRAEFSDFAEAFAFLTRVALLAQRLDHHPDMALSWSRVELTLTTHSAGGVTDLDLQLAGVIAGWLDA